MSPEQALAKRVVVDHRSDIYSLGVTLYELLTLQPAFTGDDRHELLRQIAFDEPRKPRQINAQIPIELETITLKALRKDLDNRYATALDLADDLRRFIENKAIRAKPPSWLELVVKWSKRHPAVTWASVFVLLATTISSAVSAVLINRAYQREAVQRQNAEFTKQQAVADAKRAEAMLNFLVKAFESPNPAKEGHSVTVAEVLTRAELNLDDELDGDALSQAALLTAIGKSRISLGLNEDAIGPLRKAQQIRASRLGQDHPNALDSLALLAVTYTDLDPAEATRLLESLSTLQWKVLGTDHPKTLSTMQKLAMLYASSNRLSEAVTLLQQVFETRSNTLGSEDCDTIIANALLTFAKSGQYAPWAAYGNEQGYFRFAGSGYGKGERIVAALKRASAGMQKEYGANHPKAFLFRTYWVLLISIPAVTRMLYEFTSIACPSPKRNLDQNTLLQSSSRGIYALRSRHKSMQLAVPENWKRLSDL